jgi:hypothetical protein
MVRRISRNSPTYVISTHLRINFYVLGFCKRSLAAICLALFLCSCGGGGGGNSNPPPPPPATIISVAVTSTATAVLVGSALVFTAAVQGTGSYSSAVTWAVNGIAGGNVQNGTINDGGYNAPTSLPPTNPITVTATSVQDPTKSGTATATVYAIVIAPTNPSIYYGQTQQFTATVTGENNPVVHWSAVTGQIDSNGLYTAPSQGFEPLQDTVSAIVAGGVGAVSTFVNLQPITPQIVSIVPDQGIVGQTVTLNTAGLYNATQVFFALPDGNSISANFNAISPTQTTATVPVGTTSGQVFVQYTPFDGGIGNTNSVNFTRLPNLHIRAQIKELSSGETTQFNWRLLGGSSSSAIEWAADQGTINTAGLYQAPSVTSEEFATITGCISGTQACDSVMLHLLPFRITPSEPTATLGSTLQLSAIEGGTRLSPTWSLPAADGTISQGGLFTAPTTVSQSGSVPVNAISGAYSESTSVGVIGGFPGLVNRTWDYVNFNNPANLGMFVESVATSGNRAYCVDLGAPFAASLSYAAIDVYDISNPQQPVWLDAVDSISSLPLRTSTYGNYLFTVDSGYLIPVPSRISIYNIQNQTPVLSSVTSLPDLAFSQVNGGIVYGLGEGMETGSPTFPVYTFDVRSGSVIQNEYDLTPPPGIEPGEFFGITGSGNIVYVSMLNQIGISPSLTLAAYDISKTPPALVGSVLSDEGFNRLQVANQLLFADGEAYDVSTPNPTLVASFPLISVQSVQGNQVLAYGDYFNFVVIDISNPANPVVTEDVADISSENPDGYPNAVWVSNTAFLAADGLGGLAAYDVSAPGGLRNEASNPLYEEDAAQFIQIFDQAIQSTTLYVAGTTQAGSGGVVAFDVSGSTPNPEGKLVYADEDGLAIQISGTSAFLGLSDSLKVVDISNPSSPGEIASVSVPTNALALSGTTLFDGTGDSRLVVFDVSNPVMPNQIASISIPGSAVTMRIAGNLLLVADGPVGLLTFDVSKPSSPVLLSKFSLSAPLWDVAASGTTALLAADVLGLVIVDISNPAQIKQLNQTPLPSFNPFPSFTTASSTTLAASVAIQGGLGYAGTTTDSEDAVAAISTFDFTVPTSPRLVAFRRQLGDDISVITPAGSNLFLAENGIVAEFDNSFPRYSIELYEPLPELAQTFPARDRRATSKVYSRSKLNRGGRAVPTQGHDGRKIIAPRCVVRSECS